MTLMSGPVKLLKMHASFDELMFRVEGLEQEFQDSFAKQMSQWKES